MKGKNDPQSEGGGAKYLSFNVGSGGDHERTHIRESLQKRKLRHLMMGKLMTKLMLISGMQKT